ncbi:hypothetical protein H257_16558 [Aphanomyces astaci]|uniref:Uncharacterized protein n=1 Tax=Aphanomyces astaci TaxID=112090 RepID=W4FKB8_APHAT|nr:hypothetical protein H257_16558 [Aphanomyces astaci]ETV67158.1 hypothetical protein H257_16558 [Aphanomyces astaci]|eukprot:XP_009843323.1 hypothetical protein H257_16558 [Aphanomyces astaci]
MLDKAERTKLPDEAKFAYRLIPKATPVVLDESTDHGLLESEAARELMKDIKHVFHFKQLV